MQWWKGEFTENKYVIPYEKAHDHDGPFDSDPLGLQAFWKQTEKGFWVLKATNRLYLEVWKPYSFHEKERDVGGEVK